MGCDVSTFIVPTHIGSRVAIKSLKLMGGVKVCEEGQFKDVKHIFFNMVGNFIPSQMVFYLASSDQIVLPKIMNLLRRLLIFQFILIYFLYIPYRKCIFIRKPKISTV